MTATWATIIVAAAGCYLLKLVGVSLPDSVLNHRRVQRAATLLPVAMLTALVVTGIFASGARYHVDWPVLVGVGAGACALQFGQSLVAVFLIAIVVTGVARAVA